MIFPWINHAPDVEIICFNEAEYINSLIEADKNGGKEICSGTFLNPGSWKAAVLAAGTTLSAMKYILDGHGKICYALVRPPGHHAQPTQADGYCFLNNAGIAVQYALNSGGCCCYMFFILILTCSLNKFLSFVLNQLHSYPLVCINAIVGRFHWMLFPSIAEHK